MSTTAVHEHELRVVDAAGRPHAVTVRSIEDTELGPVEHRVYEHGRLIHQRIEHAKPQTAWHKSPRAAARSFDGRRD